MKRRLLVILSVGAVLIGGAMAWRESRRMPLGQGPAGTAPDAASFKTPWTERRVLLLGLGDSVTEGFGASPGLSYFDRLVRNPEGEFPGMRGLCLSAVLPNLECRNHSDSFTVSTEHLEVLENLPVQDSSVLGLVVMTSGGNDVIHDYGRSPPEECAMYGAAFGQTLPWVRNFERRLDRMVDLIESRFPGGCQVFLADIYDPTDGVGDIEKAGLPAWPDGLKVLEAYNEVIHRCAERRESVHLVPMRALFLGHGLHCNQSSNPHYRKDDPTYWYYDNLEDPNDRGYDALRRLFLAEIARVLAPR